MSRQTGRNVRRTLASKGVWKSFSLILMAALGSGAASLPEAPILRAGSAFLNAGIASVRAAEPSETVAPTLGVPNWDATLADAVGRGTPENPFVISIPKGNYLFDAETAASEELYVSNTNLANPKKVGLTIRGLKNAVVDFNGSEIWTRGPLLSLVVEDCENVVVKNVKFDSICPAMAQTEIVRNDENGIVLRPDPTISASIENGAVIFAGDGWRGAATFGIAFDPKTARTLHGVADVGTNFSGATINEDGNVVCPNWRDDRLAVGTILVLRPLTFHLAGVFVNRCKNFEMRNVDIYYAPAKAIVAQRCENLVFNAVSIKRRENDFYGGILRNVPNSRYYTANADAIHISCCKGKVVVENGLYEAMFDDAINVHGIYVKATKKINATTVEFRYPHSEASGFEWAVPGDEICFVNTRTMERFPGRPLTVESLRPVDAPTLHGANRYEITFREPIPEGVVFDELCALENLTQTPEVVYRKNVIRNNRARGALFSTTKSVRIEENLFDHISGTALLFCGDANGWFESGPCRDVAIKNNRFVNCMTAFYQFCEAPISIYPVVPGLDEQRELYDGGSENAFLIENNVFETFDRPILYALSTDGITFKNNVVKRNDDYAPVAGGRAPFVFDKANRIRIFDNVFEGENAASGAGFDPKRDVDYRRSPEGGLRFSADEPFGDDAAR